MSGGGRLREVKTSVEELSKSLFHERQVVVRLWWAVFVCFPQLFSVIFINFSLFEFDSLYWRFYSVLLIILWIYFVGLTAPITCNITIGKVQALTTIPRPSPDHLPTVADNAPFRSFPEFFMILRAQARSGYKIDRSNILRENEEIQ